ncbi:sensor histidine kinase [Cohnella abietis]|uniref:histidine kinase n=1 Tax=Cohnella abietis TaxID=2507935 RepID=A0A3T1DE90_9BACL|nr:HAMP domain-containing sensor histidine kinase [Cohnella abietis]BBI36471.1 two-component sensor histidine kinase [Cohnella abietis]
MSINKLISSLRNNITFKVFGLTVTILLLFSVSTYLIIFTLLPHTYNNYKQQQLEHEIDTFIAKIPTLSDTEMEKELDIVKLQTNAFIILFDETKQIPLPSTQIKQGTITIEEATVADSSTPKVTGKRDNPNVTRSLMLKGKPAYLTAYTKLQPIDEASKVLMLLAPYVALFILIAAVGGSFFYTRIITRPIRRITVSASRMAELELDTLIPVHSSDEIGRLAASLNTMAVNLKSSIGDLQMANVQLQLEMERDREIETRRRELFAAVSHELKSPLTIMKGQLEGMLYKIGIYEDRDFYLDKTLHVAEEMEILISNILHVAKSDRLTLSNSDELVSLNTIVEELLVKYEELGLQRGVTLSSSIPEDIWFNTDRKLLETALNNVTHNAIIYTNAGERVMITAPTIAGSQTLEILNTGTRINEAKIEQIFEPFYRLEQSRNRNTGGSGLGLYLTKHILQQLDISIRAKNTVEGVVFSLYFPQNTSTPLISSI